MFLYKSNFHWQSNAFLWFDFQTCGFAYQGGQCIVAMFSCFKTKSQSKFTTQGLCISAMSHVELITETKDMKSMRFFYSFLKVIAENFIKNVLLEMKNGLSLSQQQLQVIMYYIITWAFNNSVADKTNAHTPQKRSILLFFRCARCATQALLNRHDFFFWKMAVDVAVVSCLSGLPDSPLSKRRPPGCSPNHSPQEGAWLRSFQRAARFVSNFRGVPSFC